MKHVVMNSAGIGSYITAKRVRDRYGPNDLIHLFADTMDEDEDAYRFLEETTRFLGGQFVKVCVGLSLWELFHKERMIANTMADICSRKLKREPCRKWLEENFPDPSQVTLYVGVDHSERHRMDAIRFNWQPYAVESPLCDLPHMSKCDVLKECERDGIDTPRLYDDGFPHNNCGGLCVKAGHAQFLHLLKTYPERFMEHALEEQAFREELGKDVAIMRDRRGGVTRPLAMLEFKRQVESGERKVNPRDWGKGCQCFIPPTETQQGDPE